MVVPSHFPTPSIESEQTILASRIALDANGCGQGIDVIVGRVASARRVEQLCSYSVPPRKRCRRKSVQVEILLRSIQHSVVAPFELPLPIHGPATRSPSV